MLKAIARMADAKFLHHLEVASLTAIGSGS
jgi:hypothetical protein